MAIVERERIDQAATGKPIVFIVDDDPDVRTAISLLASSVGLTVEVFSSANAFLDHFNSGMFGCLILDVRMPEMSGLELQKVLRLSGNCLPIIFVSAHGDVPLAAQALRAGAIDFLQKPFNPQMLLERIYESLALNRNHQGRCARADQIQHCISRLTEREREVMYLLAQGVSTKSIAVRLTISPKTAENHRAKVLNKMKVDNPTQLARALTELESSEH